MIAVLMLVLMLVVPPARGGHAKPLPARGGHATVVLEPIGNLARWTCIHEREGAWNAEGFYEGGLQFDHEFSTTYGPDMWRKYGTGPHAWSPRDQMVVAERARKVRGYWPWPNTARACGLLP